MPVGLAKHRLVNGQPTWILAFPDLGWAKSLPNARNKSVLGSLLILCLVMGRIRASCLTAILATSNIDRTDRLQAIAAGVA
jgi:hypothetical protein